MEPIQNNQIVGASFVITLLENGILKDVMNENTNVTEQVALEEMEIIKKFHSGNSRPVLVDIRKAIGVERKARKIYISKESEKYLKAVALLVGNPLSRTIGNIIMLINRPNFPMKLFTSEELAMEWLGEHLQK